MGKQYSSNFSLIREFLFLGWSNGGGARSVDFWDPAFKIRRDGIGGGVLTKQLIK